MLRIMRFILIDKIVSLESGQRLQSEKNVSLSEEYLADHFPIFPVLPGVLLLEGLIESASWLVREKQDFSKSMVLLSSATNVKYKSFLAPGDKIEYTVEVKKFSDETSSYIGYGICGQTKIVEARFSLRHFNLADDDPAKSIVDAKIIDSMKKRWSLLHT